MHRLDDFGKNGFDAVCISGCTVPKLKMRELKHEA